MNERTRKIVSLGIPFRREPVNDWPGRIREAHELAGLVETFARRIVNRAAEHAVVQFGFHHHEHRVPAADDEGDVRLKSGEVGK